MEGKITRHADQQTEPGPTARSPRPDVDRSGPPQPFELESEEAAPDGAAARRRAAAEPEGGEFPAGSERPAHSSVKDLDVCPNCGASMRDTNTVVCLRCGFDLKTLKVVKTLTGETTEAEAQAAEEVEEERPPVCRPGRGGYRLPLILLAASAVALASGYLSGARSLFPGEEAPAFGVRLVGLARGMSFVGVWALCGLAGLWGLARHVLMAKLGDVPLALVRMLAVVAVMHVLGSWIDITVPVLGWVAEFAIRGAVFVLLAMYLFSLKVFDALATAVVALTLFVALRLVSLVVG